MHELGADFFVTDESWEIGNLHAKAGVLVIRTIENASGDPRVDEFLAKTESGLREEFAGFSRDDFNKLPRIATYNDYYKKFGKTYHVRSQVESVVNGKSLPKISAILSCTFAMEVKNMLLTAGHDLDALRLPVRIKSTIGGEGYVAMNGSEKKVEPHDMFMEDGTGIISSIVHGPDSRTKITEDTTSALFAVYAPAGIGKEIIMAHLEEIQSAIRIFSPDSETELLEVFEAG